MGITMYNQAVAQVVLEKELRRIGKTLKWLLIEYSYEIPCTLDSELNY